MKKLGLWSRYYSRWDPDVHPRYDKVGVTRRDEEDRKNQVKKMSLSPVLLSSSPLHMLSIISHLLKICYDLFARLARSSQGSELGWHDDWGSVALPSHGAASSSSSAHAPSPAFGAASPPAHAASPGNPLAPSARPGNTLRLSLMPGGLYAPPPPLPAGARRQSFLPPTAPPPPPPPGHGRPSVMLPPPPPPRPTDGLADSRGLPPRAVAEHTPPKAGSTGSAFLQARTLGAALSSSDI
jgi:hypothetical protein